MEDEKRAPGAGEVCCPSCGTIIESEAESCVHCGAAVDRHIVSAPKDRVVAILLAVFLSFWTWLYTYRRDAWKFWLGLALTLTVFNPLWTWIVFFIPNIAIWIWAIVDVSVKPRSFYDYY
jgi:hypothetical protein